MLLVIAWALLTVLFCSGLLWWLMKQEKAWLNLSDGEKLRRIAKWRAVGW